MVTSNQYVALAAFTRRELVGYAIRRQPQGWYCVFSIGMSWSRTNCRDSREAQMAMKVSAHAYSIQWFSDVKELEKILQKVPDYKAPPIPDGGLASLCAPSRLTSLEPAVLTVVKPLPAPAKIPTAVGSACRLRT